MPFTIERHPRHALHRELLALVLGTIAGLLACSANAVASEVDRFRQACTDERVLKFGFFSDFKPVSSSENPTPGTAGFDRHRGYEADLLTALETMEDAGLSFRRRGIGVWPGIWLAPAGPDFDMVGGGITILDSRTRNDANETAVVFTSGHITFRQSLLVRAEDAERLASHDDLADARVGVIGGTTGEHRLLELTGMVNADGDLAQGTIVDKADGTQVTADGSADYRITAAGATPNLDGRLRLQGPQGTVAEVRYFGSEGEQFEALHSGDVDALARGEIGNREASVDSSGAFVVTALDPAIELGGFAFDKDDEALAACVDGKLNWLTDRRRIGYAEWHADPLAFMQRARLWNATEVFGQIYAYSILSELMREEFPATLERLGRRFGEFGAVRTQPVADAVGIWARAKGGHRRIENVDVATDSFGGGKWRQNRGQVEVGYDFPIPAAGPVVGGISIHAMHTTAEARKGRSYAASDIEAVGYGGALTLARFDSDGFYWEAQSRFSFWNVDVDFTSRRISESLDARSWGVSFEIGREFETSLEFDAGDFRITPRVQAVYTEVDFDDFTDGDGVAVVKGDSDSLEASAGLGFAMILPKQNLRLYVDLSVAHDFQDDSSINAYGFEFRSGFSDTWGHARLGAVKQIMDGVSIILQGRAGSPLGDDTSDALSYGAQTSLRVEF